MRQSKPSLSRKSATPSFLLLAFLSTGGLTFSTPSESRTFSQSVHFVDTNDPLCKGRSPCYSSIQAAVAATAGGDIVLVAAGIYNENVLIEDRALSLVSEEGPQRTVINGDGTTSVIKIRAYRGEASATINGFTIRAGGGSRSFIENGWGVMLFGYHDFTALIENNVITENNVNGGILLYPISTSASVQIESNMILGNHGREGGVSVDFRYGHQYTVRLANNILAFNTAAPSGGGIKLAGSGVFEVLNNTIYGNMAGYGGGLASGAAGLTTVNNIITGNTASEAGDDIYVAYPSLATIRSNLIGDGQLAGQDGNFAADPLLSDPNQIDFHLLPGSPAIDSGDSMSLTLPATDYEGDARILDGNSDGIAVVDIGADEFRSQEPPSADAGRDEMVECSSPSGAEIMLDGSLSTDPDSTPGTNDDIVSFQWYENYGTPSEILLGSGETVTVPLYLGLHHVTLKVTDRDGAMSLDDLLIEVVDSTAPVILVSLTPRTLWPPNHRLVPVTATVEASDLCTGVVVMLSSVSSNEADDGEGDGNTINDIQNAEVGTADLELRLRAERAGGGNGRVYTATYTASDGMGNTSSATGYASVPHDLGGVTDPLDLAVEQSPVGSVVRWSAVAGALSYDVVRGDVSAIGETGAVIGLGSVVCLESNSPDVNTSGSEDGAVPAPGHAFFYLVEYFDGTSSSYGGETAGKPRVPAAGNCE